MRVAMSQVGVMERGGNNRGDEIREYLASVGLPEGHPWCAAFIHWCYRECGEVIEPARRYAMALEWHRKERRVWERGGWAPDTARVFRRISEDGDHFALWYDNLGRIGHTGLIIGESEKYIDTVEGNTSPGGSREGDGVYLRRRLKRTIHCISRWPITTEHGASNLRPLAGLP